MTVNLRCEHICGNENFSLGGPLEVLYSWYCDTRSSKVRGKEWSSCEASYQPLQLVLTDAVLRLRLTMRTANCWIAPGSNWWESCSMRHRASLNQSRTTAANCGIQSSVNCPRQGFWCFGWPTCNKMHLHIFSLGTPTRVVITASQYNMLEKWTGDVQPS